MDCEKFVFKWNENPSMKSPCNDNKVEILVKSTYSYVDVIYSTQNQGHFTIIPET